MPSKSKKQAKYMTANCKSPEFRKKTGMSKKVACDFHKADKGKYHEDETMSDDALNEKVKLVHALKTEEGDDTDFRAEDISRMKRLAGINQKLDADKESGNVDFNGIFTGVASGEIPVSEGEYSFLRSLNEDAIGDKMKKMTDAALQKIVDDMDDEQVSGAAALQYRAARTELKSRKGTNESKEVDEGKKRDVDGDGDIDSDDWKAAKHVAIKKSMDEETEELEEYSRKPWEGDLKKKSKKDDEEVDESEMNRLRELSGMPTQPGGEAIEGQESVEFTGDDGEEAMGTLYWTAYVNNGITTVDPKSLRGEMDSDYNNARLNDDMVTDMLQTDPRMHQEYLALAQEYAQENYDTQMGGNDYDDSMDGDHDSAMASAGFGTDEDYGFYGESEMFQKGSLSRNMIEMIVDEMNKGKETEEISEELSFDADHVAKVVEFVKAKQAPMVEKTEEVDETKDEEVDEAKEWVKPWEKDKEVDEDKEEVDESHWWDKGSNETERLRELAGLKAKDFTEAKDEEVDEAKDEEVDETKEEDLDEDADGYLANRDRAIKERIANASNKEEIDETGDEEVDEADETEEIDEDLARMMELSGITEKKRSGCKKQ